jgi:hypothetical protein
MNLPFTEIGIFSVFCLEYYYYFKTIKASDPTLTEKQKAHIISIKNSFIMTISSIFYIYLFVNSNFDTNLNFNKDNKIFGHLIILYFMAYLFMDLGIGIFEYPNYIELLSGYIHHPVYLIISSLALYYDTNALFIFILAMFEELPTFLLSIGSFNKIFRNDSLFGITFFITRILFHAILILLFRNNENKLVFYISSLALILHLFWFKNWWTKYGKKLFNTKNVNKNKINNYN